ncbi:MAG: hypothetical protein GXP28_04375 [Planctomycetes bacterium]|nr:hypothetical protein [Planctomycetota bacterium]
MLAIAGALLAIVTGPASSWAAFITTQESELDSIFSQPSFGATPVDIRFLPTITYVDANLLNINTQSKFYDLVGQFDSSPVHNAYYVDTIDWCGGPGTNTGIVGCAFTPGNDFVVESNFSAGANGAELTSPTNWLITSALDTMGERTTTT